MKYNWFYNEAIELISLPVTILAVIFGMYSSTIDQELFRDNQNLERNFYEFELYLDFFNKQIDSLETPAKINFDKKDQKDENQFVFIDLTKSNRNKDFESKCIKFKKGLSENLDSKIEIEDKLKVLVIANYLKFLFNKPDKQNSKICIWLYEGSQTEVKFYNEEIRSENDDDWHLLNNSLLTNLLNQELDIAEVEDQTTDFQKIFEQIGIKIKDKENITLTILSDLLNDSEKKIDFSPLRIDNITKINLFNFPFKKNTSGKSILQNLQENFSYDRFSYEEAVLSDYSDNSYSSNKTEIFLNNLNASTTKSNLNSASPLKLYLPSPNIFGYSEAKTKFKIDSSDNIQWKVTEAAPITSSNNNDIIGGYKLKGEKKKRLVKLNTWYKNPPSKNEIELTITDFKKPYSVEFFDKKKNVRTNYKLHVVKSIPENLAKMGKYSLLAIMCLCVLFSASHLLKNLYFFRKNSKNMTKYKRIKHFIIEILFIVLYSLAFSILFFHSVLYLLWVLASIHLFMFYFFYRYRIIKGYEKKT